MVIRGAQSGTDIGYISATGVDSGIRSSIRVVQAGARSSVTRKVSLAAAPCSTRSGVTVTSALAGPPPTATPSIDAAIAATVRDSIR